MTKQPPLITVFTPTYNRAHLLDACHKSLCTQELKDFEWIVVDDESSDNTTVTVEGWMDHPTTHSDGTTRGISRLGGFPIILTRQPHGGKHRATNLAARIACGELFFVLDSDDHLLPFSLKHVAELYATVREDKRFGGVAAQKGHFDGTIFGPDNIHGITDMSYLERKYVRGKKGEKSEVFKTTIMRDFPQPDIEGEFFCPESLIWNRISAQFLLRYSGKIVYHCEYLPDGLTAQATRRRMRNPVATLLTYSELTRYDIPFLTKCRAAINYHRFAPCMKSRKPSGIDNGRLLSPPHISHRWFFLWPIGRLMHLWDKIRVRS